MRNRRTGRKGDYTRWLGYCTIILGASLFLLSCGAIKTLLPGDSKGLGDPFEYTLTIQYDRSGGGISYGYPTVFWVMPLDGSGEVIEDPDNPDGPPLRYEPVGTGDAGSVSAVVPYDEYAILAFIDSNLDGKLELYEPYEIYDNRTLRDGAFDRVLVDEAKSVDFVLDMLADWHVVFIYAPRENETVAGGFTAFFGTLAKQNPDFRVFLNSTEITNAIEFDDKTGVWYVRISESRLQPSMNSLRVDLYDQGGSFIDEDEVYFSYYP